MKLLKGAAPRMAMHAADEEETAETPDRASSRRKSHYSATNLSVRKLVHSREERTKLYSLVIGFGLPMLLHSSLCACFCAEVMVEYASHFLEAFAALVKELVSP